MKKLVALAGLTVGVVLSVCGVTEYKWKAVDNDYNGSFDDPAHWGGTVPTAGGDTASIGDNGTAKESYTVTMPDGVYTNYANLYVGAKGGAGTTLTIDGAGKVLVHPQIESGTYGGTPFRVCADGTSGYFMHLSMSTSQPGYNTSPNLEFSNYVFKVTSERAKHAKVEFTSGVYNFLNPLGHVWTSLPGRPILYLFANGYEYSMPLDESEIVFDAGTSLLAPTLGVTGNSSSNIVRFAGGAHVANSLAMPCISDGQKWNRERTVTDIVAENDATFTVLKSTSPNNNANASNRLVRVIARNGGTVNFNDVYPGSGEIAFAAEGGTVNFGGATDVNTDGNTKFRQMSIAASDGGELTFGNTFNFGRQPRTDGLGDLSLGLDAAAMTVGEAGKFNVYGNVIAGSNGSVITNAGLFKMDRGTLSLTGSRFENLADAKLNGGTLNFADGSSLVNRGGLANAATLNFSNGSCLENRGGMTNSATLAFADSRIENYGTLRLDGGTGMTSLLRGATLTNYVGSSLTICKSVVSNAAIATANTAWFGVGTTDLHDTTIELVKIDGEGGGKIQFGNSHYTMTTVNFYGGEIRNTYSTTAYDTYVGQESRGTLNVYGGKISVGQLFLGGGYSPYTDESVLRIEGGEVEVQCKGNGRGVGFQIAENTSRHARLILNGGRFKSYTNGPGNYDDQSAWDKRSAFFEADGGTLAAPSESPYLLYGFKEAKVGPKGLTVDNVKYVVTLEQSVFTDKDDANGEGRIILKGTGTTKFKGDLSGVSYIVADEGTFDTTVLADKTLGGLVVTNTGVVKMDLATPLTIRGNVKFARPTFSVPEQTLTVGETFTLFRSEKGFAQADLESLYSATIDGLTIPTGAIIAYSQVEDPDDPGSYLIQGTARLPETTVKEVTAGSETVSEPVAFPIVDVYETRVAGGASLTISGAVGQGALVKTGDGILRLTGESNDLRRGVELAGGAIDLDDPAKLGTANAYQPSRLVRGALNVSGPAEGGALGGPFAFAQETTNDTVVINNAVDVTMECPDSVNGKSQEGSFIKRGAGELCWRAKGTRYLPGGLGNCETSSMFWPQATWMCKPFVFDETTGVLDSGSHPAVTVFEGQLRIVGEGEGATVQTAGALALGMAGEQGSVQPGLYVDNATFHGTAWDKRWMIAPCVSNSNPVVEDFVQTPTVTLTNNATLEVYSMHYNRLNKNPGLHSTTRVYGSKMVLTGELAPNRTMNVSAQSDFYFSGKSALYALGTKSDGSRQGGIVMLNPFTMTFDDSICAGRENPTKSEYRYTRLVLEDGYQGGGATRAYATFNFNNRSQFYCDEVIPSDAALKQPITFNFNDSEWIPSVDGDFTFAWAEPEKVAVNALGAGLRLPVPAGKSWTLDHPVGGTGDVVADGDGMLVLGEAYAHPDGRTVSLSGKGPVSLGGGARAVMAAGTGTFVNGTIRNGGLALKLDDAGDVGDIPDLSGVSIDGTFKVDLGRTAENPLAEPFAPIVVYRYTETAPDVSTWRLKGTGLKNVRGIFTAKDGVVTVLPYYSGTTLIVR